LDRLRSGIRNPAIFAAVYEKLDMGVYIFFALSGFVMPFALDRGHYRLTDMGRFVTKRMIRRDPPFVLSIDFVCS
jgi:peptidoglycan/LPS O-acetylase OafA/YrhL